MKKDIQDYTELKKSQTYKFKNTVFEVASVFKTEGKRTLLHSLGKIIEKDINKS